MIGLDTNVVVRHLVQDDPKQSKAATQAFARLTPAEPGLLTTVVLVETYWVLTRGYKLPTDVVASALEALMDSSDIRTQNEPDARRALAEVRAGTDFADALIAQACQALGCVAMLSFDRNAQKRLRFQAP